MPDAGKGGAILRSAFRAVPCRAGRRSQCPAGSLGPHRRARAGGVGGNCITALFYGSPMNNYKRILKAVSSRPWVIQREKLDAIVSLLEVKAQGGQVSAELLADLR